MGQQLLWAWMGGFASAFSIKLSSSIDDVVWLAPFLTSNSTLAQRIKNSTIYISVCLIQTGVAMAIAYSGNEFVDWITKGSKNAWTTEKILTVAAGALLAVYSVKLTYEWIQECNEPDTKEDEGDENKYNKVATTEAAAAESGEAGNTKGLSARNRQIECAETENKAGDVAKKEDEKTEKTEEKDKQSSQALFVIAFIGSVDDLTLFVPMLVGKGFDIVQLMAGGFLAASLIVSFCLFLGLCKPIADCLSKIPLALIVIVFATVLLTKSFFMK